MIKIHVIPKRYPSEHRDDVLGVPFALCKGQRLWGWCWSWSEWCLSTGLLSRLHSSAGKPSLIVMFNLLPDEW